jgi:hypothetical protein
MLERLQQKASRIAELLMGAISQLPLIAIRARTQSNIEYLLQQARVRYPKPALPHF